MNYPDAPTCPICGSVMIRVHHDGKPCWRCQNWTDVTACQGRIDIRESVAVVFKETPLKGPPIGDWRWRRDTAAQALMVILDHPDYWQNDKRTAGQIAVQLTNELIAALIGNEERMAVEKGAR